MCNRGKINKVFHLLHTFKDSPISRVRAKKRPAHSEHTSYTINRSGRGNTPTPLVESTTPIFSTRQAKPCL